jgi:hypothetical protein
MELSSLKLMYSQTRQPVAVSPEQSDGGSPKAGNHDITNINKPALFDTKPRARRKPNFRLVQSRPTTQPVDTIRLAAVSSPESAHMDQPIVKKEPGTNEEPGVEQEPAPRKEPDLKPEPRYIVVYNKRNTSVNNRTSDS